jgi:tight adherence protein C
MNTFTLSLIFLSPLISYATYILLQENRDPLHGFHDNYLKSSRIKGIGKDDLSPKAAKVFGQTIPGPKVLIFIFSLALPILFLAGVSPRLIVIIGISVPAYIFWLTNSATREEKKKLLRIESEFPALVELFAVLVSAGESPSTALQRVSTRATGVLAEKFIETLGDLQRGKNLTQALERLGLEVNSTSIRRFCDTLILAMERGTSLSDVLTRQVEEVRTAHHATLMTAAGKAEIALMIPVIFLILPISVLFALWPSYLSLGQSVM